MPPPVDKAPLLALASSIPIVQAGTESGGTNMVPLYSNGMRVCYRNAAGAQSDAILDARMDNLLEPYYSVRLEDGREKQTDNAHIMLMERKIGGDYSA